MAQDPPSFFPFDDTYYNDESLDEDICPNCNKSFYDHDNDQIIICARTIGKGG